MVNQWLSYQEKNKIKLRLRFKAALLRNIAGVVCSSANHLQRMYFKFVQFLRGLFTPFMIAAVLHSTNLINEIFSLRDL